MSCQLKNSSTGGISTNYDLLLNYKNAIVGEYVMKIDQCLLALPGTKLEDIQTVFSHPQGLLQSRKFMKEHPLFEGVEYGSTAAAAKKVAQDKDKTQAAIASRRAAKEYGLEIVADSIQQEKNNCTRFIIIGPKEVYTKESNKLALCIELPHQSGTLYRILSHFLYNDLNMTQIESRPIRDETGNTASLLMWRKLRRCGCAECTSRCERGICLYACAWQL